MKLETVTLIIALIGMFLCGWVVGMQTVRGGHLERIMELKERF